MPLLRKSFRTSSAAGGAILRLPQFYFYVPAVLLSVFSTAALLSVYDLLFPFFFLNFSSFSSGSSFAMESRSFSNSASRSLVTSGY